MTKVTLNALKNFCVEYHLDTTSNIEFTKKDARKMSHKDLLCFVALATIQFGRSVEDSIANANAFDGFSDEYIIDTFFTKDFEENDI